MRLSMPDAPAQGSGKARRLRPVLLLLAALCVAVAAGSALRRFGGNGPTSDAVRPSLSGSGPTSDAAHSSPSGTGSPAAAPASAPEAAGKDDTVVPPPVVVRGTGTPTPDSAPGAGAAERGAANYGEQGTADAGERERILRLAEEDAERRLQEATSQEAAAAIAYRRAVAGAARGRSGNAEPAEAEAALERARAAVRAARRDFESASRKRAEAGAEVRRAAGTAGPGFPGRSMPRQSAAGQSATGQESSEQP
ncbi:MAG: hypothetical protein LBR82_06030 [Desulfovibrio sp.]|jgi:hypothetical protein|nr:hypothetical protein [Desulfovibrio sp.]